MQMPIVVSVITWEKTDADCLMAVAGIEMEVVDFCAISNGGCDHKCQHTREGPICSCRKGYKLMADKKGCRGTSVLSLISFVVSADVKRHIFFTPLRVTRV